MGQTAGGRDNIGTDAGAVVGGSDFTVIVVIGGVIGVPAGG